MPTNSITPASKFSCSVNADIGAAALPPRGDRPPEGWKRAGNRSRFEPSRAPSRPARIYFTAKQKISERLGLRRLALLTPRLVALAPWQMEKRAHVCVRACVCMRACRMYVIPVESVVRYASGIDQACAANNFSSDRRFR